MSINLVLRYCCSQLPGYQRHRAFLAHKSSLQQIACLRNCFKHGQIRILRPATTCLLQLARSALRFNADETPYWHQPWSRSAAGRKKTRGIEPVRDHLWEVPCKETKRASVRRIWQGIQDLPTKDRRLGIRCIADSSREKPRTPRVPPSNRVQVEGSAVCNWRYQEVCSPYCFATCESMGGIGQMANRYNDS